MNTAAPTAAAAPRAGGRGPVVPPPAPLDEPEGWPDSIAERLARRGYACLERTPNPLFYNGRCYERVLPNRAVFHLYHFPPVLPSRSESFLLECRFRADRARDLWAEIRVEFRDRAEVTDRLAALEKMLAQGYLAVCNAAKPPAPKEADRAA